MNANIPRLRARRVRPILNNLETRRDGGRH